MPILKGIDVISKIVSKRTLLDVISFFFWVTLEWSNLNRRRVKGMDSEDVPIPIDFFISRKIAGLSHGERGFADSLGSIVYRVKAQPESHTIKLVLDAAGRPVCSILQCQVSL